MDISDKIPRATVEILEVLDGACRQEGIPFFVVGAAARDLIMRYAFDLPIRRATRDIDAGIRVEGWDQYDRLFGILIATGEFQRTDLMHRLDFKKRTLIDIIPFGPIASVNNEIDWPPGGQNVMDILGFPESFASAIPHKLRRDPPFEVLVASLAGLALMKLISWDAGYPSRARDAADFFFVAESYIDAGQDDRLWGDAGDLATAIPFDRTLAGARLLGRDMARLAERKSRARIKTILSMECDPTGKLSLVSDIAAGGLSMNDRADEILNVIRSIHKGFFE